MIDLPQEAAQIGIWKHFHDPCYHFAGTYGFDWFTPYLFGYGVVRAIASVVSVETAFRIALYLTALALPLALLFLFQRAGADHWLSLLGFPLAFGFTFYFGFINYLIAIPIAVVYIGIVFQFSRAPDWRLAMMLPVLSLFLLASHAVIFLYCVAVTVVLSVFVRPISRAAAVVLTMSVPVLVLLAWGVSLRLRHDVQIQNPIRWNPGIYRLSNFPSMLLSNERDVPAIAFCAATALTIILGRPSITREWRRWSFFVYAAIAYLLAPQAAAGRAYMFERFAVFLAIAMLSLVGPPRGAAWKWSRSLLVAAVISWMAVLAVRFHRFGAEARSFDSIAAAIPSNRRVAFFTAAPRSDFVPGAVYFHFPAYYQVHKGGVVSWSFAAAAPQLVRLRAGAAPQLGGSPLFYPDRIDWQGLSNFDFLIIRDRVDPTPALAAHAPYRLFPVRRSDTWWLYATPRGNVPRESCPPLR